MLILLVGDIVFLEMVELVLMFECCYVGEMLLLVFNLLVDMVCVVLLVG